MFVSCDDILLHTAKITIDWNGAIYDNKILEEVATDMIVRVSLFVSSRSQKDWIYDNDSPYVKILQIKDEYMLGCILPINRKDDDYKYPIRTGDKIWFKKENIIEVPSDRNEQYSGKFCKHITDKYVTITGPLYTVVYVDDLEFESETDSDTNDDYSPSGTDDGSADDVGAADDDDGDNTSDNGSE
jgi:hypothetical protein